MRFRMSHILMVLLVFAVSCDESLPPRQDPSAVFVVQARPVYYYAQTANSMLVELCFINNFDETLSDRLDLNGTMVITSKRDTSVHKTFTIANQNLVYGSYVPSTGILTVDPGDSIVFGAMWDFTDDYGRQVPSILFQYHVDPLCAARLISDPETFNVLVSTRLFAPLAYTTYRSGFEFRHLLQWVSPHDCHPL